MQQAADDTTEGHPEIERRQVAGRGAILEELAVEIGSFGKHEPSARRDLEAAGGIAVGDLAIEEGQVDLRDVIADVPGGGTKSSGA